MMVGKREMEHIKIRFEDGDVDIRREVGQTGKADITSDRPGVATALKELALLNPDIVEVVADDDADSIMVEVREGFKVEVEPVTGNIFFNIERMEL